MYYTHILRSPTGRYYIGSTGDMEAGLRAHNSGKVRSTKAFAPWEVVRLEEFHTCTEARERELQLKSFKGGDAFRKLVSG